MLVCRLVAPVDRAASKLSCVPVSSVHNEELSSGNEKCMTTFAVCSADHLLVGIWDDTEPRHSLLTLAMFCVINQCFLYVRLEPLDDFLVCFLPLLVIL